MPVPFVKCYYCGAYVELAEANDWLLCIDCEIDDEIYHAINEDEREEYVLKDEEVVNKYLKEV